MQTISSKAQETIFNPTNPILQEYLLLIRDSSTDRPTFRKSIAKIGEYLAIEISKKLNQQEQDVLTSMNEKASQQLSMKI